MNKKPLLEIDAKGFARIQGDKPKSRIFAELYQNAKDEAGVEVITIDLTPVPGRPLVEFKVTDDSPEGFVDLSHAYTLFAPSYKLDHPEKSGWMNLGEKMVIVGCKSMTIHTTKGTVEFDMDTQERKDNAWRKRDKGTEITGQMKMTREEYEECLAFLHTLLVPEGIVLKVNGVVVPQRSPFRTFKAKLKTRILGADAEGFTVVKPTERETTVRLFEVKKGEVACLYELGIPVCPNGAAWHYDIGQKVPLGKDRDSVPESYLTALHTVVLNNTVDLVTSKDVSEIWVREAASNEKCTNEAIGKVLTLRYGDKYAGSDPSDREAENTAKANGYEIVQPRSLTVGERANAVQAGILKPAGQFFRTPRPFSDDPDAPPVEIITKWTEGMRKMADYATWLGQELLGKSITVQVVKELGDCRSAAFGPSGVLYFSLKSLGYKWFDQAVNQEVNGLLLHEFAHTEGHGHLDHNYHKWLCRLAAKMVDLALFNHSAMLQWRND